MNPAQKLAASKAGEHMGRRPMDPKPKGKNFLQKAGEFITGGATAKELTSPSWWAKGLANEANQSIVQPVYRTASGQNLRTAVAPSSTLNQRINAIGEDALNVLGVIPMAAPAARASVAAERAGARALASAKAGASAKMTPTASLDNYILHGGVAPERLIGDSIDPTFVRGGDKFIRNDINPPSVKHGPNALEDSWYLGKEEEFKAILSSDAQPGVKAKSKEWLDKHEEILKRIKAGEDHGTGVHRLNPFQTYRSEGGMYLLDVPLNLQSTNAISPAGEVQFWGAQKPVGFVRNAQNRTGSGRGADALEDKAIMQMMIDDADIKAKKTQKLANMFARATGTKITPAYKRFAEEVFERNFGGQMGALERNPNFGKPGEIVEYFTKYPAEYAPKITNYDQIIPKLRSAKTEQEIYSLLDELVPNEQLDIMLRSTINKTEGGLQELKRRVVDFISGIDPSYSRLKSVGRNGPIIINEAPYPKNLVNWDSLNTPDGKLFAFANKFMDRRTPPEIVEQVYDPELFKLMFDNPQEGYRILNQRLSQAIGKK